MKIGIVGHGYVGSAIAHAHRAHTLVVHDPQYEYSQPLEQVHDCDAVYVCVPSPAGDDGRCDSSILRTTVEQLATIVSRDTPIICKTTAPPEDYLELQQSHRNTVFAPEFLTARNNMADYKDTRTFILGGYGDICHKAAGIILKSDVANNHFIITDIVNACLYKYLENSFLATKVTFMNDYKSLCDAYGADWSKIQTLIGTDPRLGTLSHTYVPGHDGLRGWGGHCFPKDISAIIAAAADKGVELELLKAVKSRNEQHRNCQ